MNAQNLLTDETVIYEGKLHWHIFLWPVLLYLFVLSGCVWLLIAKYALPAGLLFLAALPILLPALLRYATNGLVLTNKRVIAIRGLFSRQSMDISLQKIEGVSTEQNLFGQFFNYGSIMIRGTGGGWEKFPSLSAPAEFSKALHQQIGKPL